ncbi:MAG TPA: ATP-binding protein [Anaerohalosphaeraceae bacterium]|nr:ATP-binding protein [Anaerohalosphaeraceae bacterium]
MSAGRSKQKPIKPTDLSEADPARTLESVEKDFHTIFDCVPAAIWYRDRKGIILQANRCAADLVGMSVEDLIGKNYYDLFPDGAEKALEKDLQVILSGQPMYKQLRKYVTADQQIRWTLADRIPYLDENGEAAGVIVMARDITEQKAAEEQLDLANQQIDAATRQLRAAADRTRVLAEEAVAANRTKSEFLAHMSHELRTPMNSILGFSDLLREEPLSDQQQQYVQNIFNSANTLLVLINDLLDFSKIEAGTLNIEILPCRPAEMVQEIRDLLEPPAREKGLQLQVDCSPDLPDSFFTDPMRLRQCLVNLVSNAIKFTQQGHVIIRVYVQQRAGQDRIRIDVEDTGIGIEPAKQELIFDSFVQADASVCRQYGGMGLGLTIARRLAGLLGGHIELVSQPGQGSTFSIILPQFVEANQTSSISSRQDPSEPVEPDDRHIGCIGKVLLIENKTPSQIQTNLLLRRAGLDVQIVNNAADAFERLRQEPAQVVLINLDEVDEAKKLAAQLHNQDERLPIIAVTDDTSRKVADQFKIAGCNAVLVEPVSRGHLYETIRSFLIVQTSASSASAPLSSRKRRSHPFNEAESMEALLEKLPTLMEEMMEFYSRSDFEMLSRFAKVLMELGTSCQRKTLVGKARQLHDCLANQAIQPDELQRHVEELNELCLQISLGR